MKAKPVVTRAYFGQSIQITQWYYSLKKLPEAAQLLERIPKSVDGLIVVLPDHELTNASSSA